MARGRGRGPQQQVKGFRPGKEPPRLRKQRAKQQFTDLSPTQERLVEVFAEKTPQEARDMIHRWTRGLLIATIAVALLAVGVSFWSTVAGVVAGVIAALLLVVWWRIRSQRDDLHTLADAVSGGRGGKRRRKKR